MALGVDLSLSGCPALWIWSLWVGLPGSYLLGVELGAGSWLWECKGAWLDCRRVLGVQDQN